MIGLHRQSILLEEPNEEWSIAFRNEKALIEGSMSDIGMKVEHIGSTAVPGLLAKPIIDIGVLLSRAEDLHFLQNSLVAIGYIFRGDKGSGGGHLFVREREQDVRTHHVHVIVKGDPAWEKYLRFRDALRADVRLRRDYALLKQSLERQLRNNRAAYTRAKTVFISEVLGSA